MKYLKVSTRLQAGFGVLLIFLLLGAALGLYGMSSIYADLDNIVNVNDEESRMASALQASVLDRSIAIRNLILVSDDGVEQKQLDRIRDQDQAFEDAYAQLGKLFTNDPDTTDREKSLYTAIKQNSDALKPLNGQIERLVHDGQRDEAINFLNGQVLVKSDALKKSISDLASFEVGLNRQAAASAGKRYGVLQTIVWIAVPLSLLFGVFGTIVISRSITRQLGGEPAEAQEAARLIANGNLATEVRYASDNPTSLMASLDSMRRQLNEIVSKIKTAAVSISDAAGEISLGNTDLSRRTEAQAASLEETAASMEELTSTVLSNTERAREGNTLASSASSAAQTGGAVVEQVITTMNGISESSSRVTDIIAVIEGIAFQINILALNAAVEAARAGEQGRGFAVVAGEVRTLAQRSATAAKEIKELITTSVQRIDTGSRQVHAAGLSMKEIVTSVASVSAIMAQIAAASGEQSMGIEQINVAVNQMDEVTQQNAALVEQASAAAQAMASQASQLSEMIAVFSLERGQRN